MFTFSIDPSLVVQLLVAFLLPVLVGLVSTRVTSGAKKALLLAGLSLIASLLGELGRAIADNTPYDIGLGLLLALPAFVISVASHFGLWKPTGVSDAVISAGSSPTYSGDDQVDEHDDDEDVDPAKVDPDTAVG